MTTSSTSIDPSINEHIQMMTGDPTAYDAWVKSQGIKKITPDMIPDSIKQIYINQANEQLNPWYKNEQAIGSAKLGNQVGQTQADYQNTIDQLNQGLSDEQRNLTNKSASQGAFGSTAYQENQKSLANQYNNKFSSAYNNANSNLQNYGLANEVNYGGQMPTSNINQYQVNPIGQTNQTGATAKYNPFGVQNALDINKSNSANNLAENYLGARIKNPNYSVNYKIPTTYVNQ